MKSLLLLGHLGLGDHLICNGMIRSLSEKYGEINVLCKKGYLNTLKLIFEDLKNINFVPTSSDEQAVKYVNDYNKYYDETMLLGQYGNQALYEYAKFDESFYKQASIPFEHRWSKFYIPHEDVLIEEKEFIFLHDDSSRGLNIDLNKVSKDIKIIRPEKEKPFLYYLPYLKAAKEIHCFDSSFALLAEHIHTTGNLFLHRYVRSYVYPVYKKDWKIIW